MSLLESALETLEKNWPKGLFDVALEGTSFSTLVKYCCALVAFPDWMAETRWAMSAAKEF